MVGGVYPDAQTVEEINGKERTPIGGGKYDLAIKQEDYRPLWLHEEMYKIYHTIVSKKMDSK